MNIKSTILKKRLAKNGSLVDTFVIEQMYDLLSTLVTEEHNDMAQKKRAEFDTYTRQIAEQLTRLSDQLENNVKKTGDSYIQELQETVTALQRDVAAYKESCSEYYKTEADAAVSAVVKAADKVLANVERFKGEKGDQGIPGKPGANGSPDTPAQVVDKVNSAKKKIKMLSIEGLEDRLNDIKKMVRRDSGGGKTGGGMGNVLHETKNLTAATTSVTLDYKPAAGGRAVWVCYQGQFLVYGTHYTISERTVSLSLDNIANGTFLDITYIRG